MDRVIQEDVALRRSMESDKRVSNLRRLRQETVRQKEIDEQLKTEKVCP